MGRCAQMMHALCVSNVFNLGSLDTIWWETVWLCYITCDGPTGPATCRLQRWHLDDINHADKKLTLAGHLVSVRVHRVCSYSQSRMNCNTGLWTVWTCRIWSSYCSKLRRWWCFIALTLLKNMQAYSIFVLWYSVSTVLSLQGIVSLCNISGLV